VITKDKTCEVSTTALKAFNAYTMYKQQNINLGNKINYNDAGVQKNIAKDAVFF